MWTIWDKISNINAMSAESFLIRNKHLAFEEIIYLKTINNQIVQVEGKTILSKIYNIDITLDNETFIQEYENIITELNTFKPSEEEFNPYADR